MHAPSPRRTNTAATFVRTAALALLALLAVIGPPAASAAAVDSGDVAWTVRTGSNSFGDDRSSFSYSVNPGGQVKDSMVVANRGPAPLTLDVYAADGFTTDKGQLDLLPRAKKSVGLGAWVRAAGGSVQIAPGKSAEVPFTVSVPTDATPGDYVGGILTSLTQPDDAEGINVDRRLGIRIKLRVSGELKPALAVEKLHVDYSGTLDPFSKGDAAVTYTIHNTGNAVLSAQQKVSLAGPFGWLRTDAGKVPAPPELLPGESWKVTVPVRGVAPAVRLTATVTLTPLLTDASGSTSSLHAVRATSGGWAVPWTVLVLLVVVVAAVTGVLLLVRRTRRRRAMEEKARVDEAVEKALREQKSQAR